MLETPKAWNVYHLTAAEDATARFEVADFADSTTPHRKTSAPFMRMRRLSQLQKKTNGGGAVMFGRKSSEESSSSSSSGDSRKTSGVADFEDDLAPRPLYARRMSVPEKVFLSADYAILRPTLEADAPFEIVAAFDRYADPYRRYMQSLTCYDLAPTHGSVVVIDASLKVHKALTALVQSGHAVAVVADAERGNSLLTVSDCLRAIVRASEGDTRVADQTLSQFLLATNQNKKWTAASVNSSVWDAARLFCVNKVNRLPIVQSEPGEQAIPGGANHDVLYILTLRTILVETVLKLSDAKSSLGPHVRTRSVGESEVGTWKDIPTLQTDALCRDAIQLFFDRNISCVAVVDEQRRVEGLLSKSDLMSELLAHPLNYLEILDIPVARLMSRVPPSAFGTSSMSILEAVGMLVASDRPCLFVLDVHSRPLAVMTYFDLMGYIQQTSEVHHKMSVA